MYKGVAFLLFGVQGQLLIEIVQQLNLVKLGGCGDKGIYRFIRVPSAFDCGQ
jgi:hypothetical protein